MNYYYFPNTTTQCANFPSSTQKPLNPFWNAEAPSNKELKNQKKRTQKKKKELNVYNKTKTSLTSWWGWSRGSVRDRARELELRGKTLLFFDPDFGYRSEVVRSKGSRALCCWCCWNRIAAARTCSRVRAASGLSFLEERTRVHLLLELLGKVGLGRRLVGFFFIDLGAIQAHKLPILGS